MRKGNTGWGKAWDYHLSDSYTSRWGAEGGIKTQWSLEGGSPVWGWVLRWGDFRDDEGEDDGGRGTVIAWGNGGQGGEPDGACPVRWDCSGGWDRREKEPWEVKRKWSESRSVVPDSLRPHGLYSPWNSPGLNTGVGSCALLQRIFSTQGSNPGLPRGRRILYQPSHQGNSRILEGEAYPFSGGIFLTQQSNRGRVSCIIGRFFTNWAITEALEVK